LKKLLCKVFGHKRVYTATTDAFTKKKPELRSAGFCRRCEHRWFHFHRTDAPLYNPLFRPVTGKWWKRDRV
jgi:hypothetical protein